MLALVASIMTLVLVAVFSTFVTPTLSATTGFTIRVAYLTMPPPIPVTRIQVKLVTVTLAGTVAAAVLLLVSVTTIPPAGAGPLRVTVPVEVLPPVTLAGLRLRVDRVGAVVGLTVSMADCVTPP